MSDTPSSAPYTPEPEHVRTAWRYAMTGETTPDAAADAAFDRYEEQQKARSVSIGHIAAQEAFQSTLTDVLNTHAADVLRRCADAIERSDARQPSDAVWLLRDTARQIETPAADDEQTEGAA